MKKCAICGSGEQKKRGKRRTNILRHHVSYHPEVTIYLCRTCHFLVHNYLLGWTESEDVQAIIPIYERLKKEALPVDYEQQRSAILSARLPSDLMDAIERITFRFKKTKSEFVTEAMRSIVDTSVDDDNHPLSGVVVAVRFPNELLDWLEGYAQEKKGMSPGQYILWGIAELYKRETSDKVQKVIPGNPYEGEVVNLQVYDPLKHVRGSLVRYFDKECGHYRAARILSSGKMPPDVVFLYKEGK